MPSKHSECRGSAAGGKGMLKELFDVKIRGLEEAKKFLKGEWERVTGVQRETINCTLKGIPCWAQN